jgi:hypothetical protein
MQGRGNSGHYPVRIRISAFKAKEVTRLWPFSKIKDLEGDVARYKEYYEREQKERIKLANSMGGWQAVHELEFLREEIKKFAVVEYVKETWRSYYTAKRTLPEAEQELRELQVYSKVLEAKLTPNQISNAKQEHQALLDIIKT